MYKIINVILLYGLMIVFTNAYPRLKGGWQITLSIFSTIAGIAICVLGIFQEL